MSKEVSLTADEKSRLNEWIAAIDDPDMKFFEDGKGDYLSARQIEREITSGTDFGREMLKTILNLP